MKSSKYFLITIVLMLFLCISTVSANNTELIDNGEEVSNTNDINIEESSDIEITSNSLPSVYVNSSSTSATEDGSQANPYKKISSAVGNSPNGANLNIANGEYVENEKITIESGDFSFIGENKDGVFVKSTNTGSLFECIDKGVKLSFSNITFSGNNAGSTAVIKIGGNESVKIQNSNFYNFNGKYGALHLYTSSDANVNNCNFVNASITATAGAGAIYLSGAGKYNINNCKFNNILYNGSTGYMYGVIYAYDANSEINILNSTFTNCKGVAYSIIYARSKINFINSTISNCVVNKSSSGYQGDSLFYTFTTGIINIKGSIIKNNTLSNYLFYNRYKLNIDSSAVYDNKISNKTLYNSATCNSSEVWWGNNTLPDLGNMILSNYTTMNADNITNPVIAGNTIDIDVKFYINGTNQIANIPDGIEVMFDSDDGVLNSSSILTKNGIAKVKFITSAKNENLITANSGNQTLIISVNVLSPVGLVYVSKSGNDSNNGSRNSPVLTIAKAIELANLGSGEIIILDGVYNEFNFNITKNLTITGGNNIVIDANGSGSIFNVNPNITLYLSNLNLTGARIASTTSTGGAIYNNGGKTIINNLNIYNNSAGYGGAIYNTNSGTLIISNSKLYNNSNTRSGGWNTGGGAIYNTNNAILDIDNSEFFENLAKGDGAVIQSYKANLTVNNSIFYNNTATAWGGAIFSEEAKVLINNSLFYNDNANNGVLYSRKSNMNILNSIFYNNTATYYPSILYNYGSVTFLDNCTIFSNNARDGIFRIEDLTNINASLTIVNSKIYNNTASTGPAIIFTQKHSSSTNGIFVNISNSILVNNSGNNSVSNNDRLLDLVKVYMNNNWWGDNDNPSKIGLANTNLSTWIIMNVSHNGTSNLNIGDSVTITVDFNHYIDKNNNTSLILDNSIFNGWGVSFDTSTGILNSSSAIIHDGIAKVNYKITNLNSNIINVHVDNQTITIKLNISFYDGIIYVSKSGNDSNNGSRNSPVLTIAKAIELANLGSGEIIVSNGTYFERDLTVNNNLNITGEGNVIINGENKDSIFKIFPSNVIIKNIKIINGESFSGSGGIFVNMGNLTLINTSLLDSKSNDNGGAIYSVGNLIIINSTISNNYAPGLGGAIYMDKNINRDNVLIIKNSVFNGNHVKGDSNKGGGAIYMQAINGEIAIDNSTFINNYVTGPYSGGAIYSLQCDSNVKITNSSFINNSANPAVNYGGGAICFIGDNFSPMGSLNIIDSIFLNNKANGSNAGGAIYVRSSTLNIKNSAIINNTDNNGIAIYRGTSSYTSTTVNANYNWWGTNDNPSKFVANGININQWLFMTFENISTILVGSNVEFIVKLNKYTNGTNVYVYLEKLHFDCQLKIISNEATLYDDRILNGEYKFNYTIPSNFKYISATIDNETITIYYINETDTILFVDNITKYYLGNERLEIYLKDGKGNALYNQTVFIEINGRLYNRTTDNNGFASMGINLIPNTYSVYVYFNGTNIYSKSDANVSILILSTIHANDTVLYYKGYYKVLVLDSEGNLLIDSNVSINIDGILYYTLSDSQGIANFLIDLDPGDYTVTVTNPNDNLTISNTITVKATISGKDIVKYYRNGTEYYAVLLDSQGNYLANGTNVTVNINDVNHIRQMGVNGTLKVTINLNPGDYNITVTNPNDNSTLTNNITVLSTISGKDIVKYFRNGTHYFVTVLDGEGKAIVGRNVTMNINGVFYNRTTDSNGTVRLAINLNPGNYTITVINPNDGLEMSNNILVKPTIFGENIVKYYRNGTHYFVTVLDGEGKAIVGRNVTMNINGVFYNRTTDSNGTARLAINLNPGNYTVTVINPNDGLQMSNNILVKTTMTGKNLTKPFGGAETYDVTVLDGKGKPLTNQTVEININGVFYKGITDISGIVRLNINLNPGNYIATAYWNEYATSNRIVVNLV